MNQLNLERLKGFRMDRLVTFLPNSKKMFDSL